MYYAEIGGTNIPARNSVATSESFLANAPAGSELLPAAAAYATAIPSPENLPEVDAAINDGVDRSHHRAAATSRKRSTRPTKRSKACSDLTV